MVETDKEYNLRTFSCKLIDFIDKLTWDDNMCDCDSSEGKEPFETIHEEDCSQILIRKDIEQFQKELHELGGIDNG